MRAEERQTAKKQHAYSSAKAAYFASSSIKEVILVFFEELDGSAVSLTIANGRNDYKSRFLFCNGFFTTVIFGLFYHCKRHKARPHDMHAGSNALQQRFVPQPLMRSSWQQLEQRASTKVLKAAGVAVKLATACAQGGIPCQQTRATVKVSTDLTPAFFMAKAHSLRVDPVVITSSINTTRLFLRRSGCLTLKAFLTLEIRA